MHLGIDTKVTLLAAGLIFLLALALGAWKRRAFAESNDGRGYVYVYIAHRAALLYSVATVLVAVFVELSAWPTWVNMTAAMVMVYLFVTAIGGYMVHGALHDTAGPFENPSWGLKVAVVLLLLGEIGGFAVILSGFGIGEF
ncbi:hypothetical protein [Mycolicibacter minnesotensis]